MKIQEVTERVAEIDGVGSWDPERAHGLEDRLYLDVLKAIVGGARNARRLAAEAIKTAGLDFPRW